mgnify:CR=1 FL=1
MSQVDLTDAETEFIKAVITNSVCELDLRPYNPVSSEDMVLLTDEEAEGEPFTPSVTVLRSVPEDEQDKIIGIVEHIEEQLEWFICDGVSGVYDENTTTDLYFHNPRIDQDVLEQVRESENL